MKLELKHLAPYQEHKVKLLVDGRKYNIAYLSTKRIAFIDIQGYGDVEKMKWEYASGKVQPILKPLDDLDKEIESMKIDFGSPEHNKLKYLVLSKDTQSYQNLKYSTILYLSENHYDFQFLIEKGLAYDINKVGGFKT